MASDEARLLEAQAALQAGDWPRARALFETVVQHEDSGAAREGLGEALWWLDEVDLGLQESQRAYTLYRAAGEACRAARVAVWLARHHIGAHGNMAAGNGWMRRAERLLEDAGPCAELGWLEQLRSKMASGSAAAAEHAARALDIARTHRDVNLEVWALSEHGRALVSMGRFEEGMSLLDEAVAAATAGETDNLLVVGDTCCNMISACDRAADFERAAQWCRILDDFTRRHHCVPIFHFCRVVYSGVLLATGRWQEAEEELLRAARAVEHGHPAQTVHSLSRLALLRVRQGRLEEAASLLASFEGQRAAVEPLAELYLMRGEALLAAGLVERRVGVEETGDDLMAVPLLRVLAEAQLAANRIAAADNTATRLAGLAERSGRPWVAAAAEFARGRIASQRGEVCAEHFEHACGLFDELGMPFDAARARLEWAGALVTSHPEIAAEYARQAQAAFEKLGARPCADRATALLRNLGKGSRPGPRTGVRLSRREAEVLDLVSHGLSNSDIAARLFISPKTVEHHVGRILSKLGLRSRAEAIAWALRNPAKSGP